MLSNREESDKRERVLPLPTLRKSLKLCPTVNLRSGSSQLLLGQTAPTVDYSYCAYTSHLGILS